MADELGISLDGVKKQIKNLEIEESLRMKVRIKLAIGVLSLNHKTWIPWQYSYWSSPCL